ncbi:13526_t:CDS:1, partial [Dentiscutata heterogama]
YVIVQPDRIFDLAGKKFKLGKSDQMEFVDVAKELGRSIDLSYYFENTITRLCTQFIICDKRHKLPSTDKIMQLTNFNKKYKQINIYAQNKAKK